MALAIKNIPVLTGKVAEDFIKQAEINEKKRVVKSFSSEPSFAQKIIEKSNKYLLSIK